MGNSAFRDLWIHGLTLFINTLTVAVGLIQVCPHTIVCSRAQMSGPRTLGAPHPRTRPVCARLGCVSGIASGPRQLLCAPAGVHGRHHRQPAAHLHSVVPVQHDPPGPGVHLRHRRPQVQPGPLLAAVHDPLRGRGGRVAGSRLVDSGTLPPSARALRALPSQFHACGLPTSVPWHCAPLIPAISSCSAGRLRGSIAAGSTSIYLVQCFVPGSNQKHPCRPRPT